MFIGESADLGDRQGLYVGCVEHKESAGCQGRNLGSAQGRDLWAFKCVYLSG